MTQLAMFEPNPVLHDFDGDTYEPAKDKVRLNRQLDKVKSLMLDGVWRSLRDISLETGFPEASISARLRDLRKPRFGALNVERRRVDCDLFQYRIPKCTVK